MRILNFGKRAVDALNRRCLNLDGRIGRILQALFRQLGGFRIAFHAPGNSLEIGRAITQNVEIVAVGTDNAVCIRDGARVSDLTINLTGRNARIVFESNVRISGLFMFISGDDVQVTVGRQTTMTRTSVYVTDSGGEITIGERCMIALNTVLRCGDGHAVFCNETGAVFNQAHHIRIGDHVWLTADVLVLKNTEIGDDCVVAARSIVTRDIPANSLAGGSPARVIRSSINWDRESVDRFPRRRRASVREEREASELAEVELVGT